MQILHLENGKVLWQDDTRANLSEADLPLANLHRANLFGANLFGADLSGADLSGADLALADLRMANLSGATLSRANLSMANLAAANLYRANLFGANLAGANLSGANLIVGGQRSDGYRFLAYKTDAGVMVRAGCRYMSVKEARKHWETKRKGTLLGAESLILLDCLVAMAKAAKWKIEP